MMNRVYDYANPRRCWRRRALREEGHPENEQPSGPGRPFVPERKCTHDPIYTLGIQSCLLRYGDWRLRLGGPKYLLRRYVDPYRYMGV